jgi:hypothetical protein
MPSSQIDDMHATESLRNQSNASPITITPFDRNRTISRMLQLYRNRRRQAVNRDHTSDNSDVPRTLTQNYVDGLSRVGSVFDHRHSQSLSHLNARSQSQRRNLDSRRMDQLVRQLRSERRDEDEEDLSGNNNFDRTATLIEENTQRPQIRRPITRAAGYDSRAQANGNTSRRGLREINPIRPRNLANLFSHRMPTYDDNFLSRSESQIQQQFHQRSQGLAPRLNNQGMAHHQSI